MAFDLDAAVQRGGVVKVPRGRHLGSARVTAIGDRVATLVVRASYDTIERGDLLGPWTERLVRPVAVRPNQASLDGVILALHPSILTAVGEYDVVYVDKGRDDGVPRCTQKFLRIREGT